MKSKPGNKKAKADTSNLGPPSTPENQKSSNASSASPSGSTSSASSLLSVGPPPYTGSGNVATAGTSGAGASAAAGGSASAKNSAKSKGGAGAASKDVDKAGATGHSAPTFPILTHFNLADFPKINACIVGSKGPTSGASSAPPSVGDANKPIDNLSMEDIDTLQTELETLWSSVATRIRLISREQGNLQSAATSTTHHHNLGLEHFDPQHQEKVAAVASIIDHGTRTSVSAAAKLVMGSQLAGSCSPIPSPSPATQAVSAPIGKRNTKGERLPKKKLKGEGGAGGVGKSKKAGDKPAARATQNRSHSVSSDLGVSDPAVSKSIETPNQFWEFVDPYCREITKEDINRLEAIYEEQRHLPKEILEVPPLGKHFRDDDETVKRRAKEQRAGRSKDSVGTMTQRLVSALVDEKVAVYNRNRPNSPKEDAGLASPGCSSNPEGGVFIQRPGLVRALGLDGGAAGSHIKPDMESRVRDVLLENGLLLAEDANDPLRAEPDDEVLAEIYKTLGYLNKVHKQNSDAMASLIANAKHEYDRYAHQRDLEKADRDVIEAYKTVAGSRLKKKPITKKEKESVTKALESRKKALSKLEGTQGKKKGGGGGARNGAGTSASAVAPVGPAV